MREEVPVRSAAGHGHDSPVPYALGQPAQHATRLLFVHQSRSDHPTARLVSNPFHFEFRPAIQRAANIKCTAG